MTTPTVAEALERAISALEGLGSLGEEIEDEWQYVTDLVAVYRGRLSQVASARAGESLAPPAAAAIETAIEEGALITDPHRAIDWLSTLPQVVLFTVGETA
jgi:DNA-binding transcriptional regulator YdaS (Cro superfamily)